LIKTATEDDKTKKDLKITGMTANDSGNYIYRVLIDGEVKWVKKSYLTPKYFAELCEFYEENLIIKN
jgi:hypothetical protein